MENTSAQPGDAGRLVAELLKTKEIKDLSADLVEEILAAWAGERFIRKKISAFANRTVRKSFEETQQALLIKDLAADSAFMKDLSAVMLNIAGSFLLKRRRNGKQK